jgi:hypothetical protein
MPNLYGVANAPGPVVVLNQPGDVACPVGANTIVASSPPLIAPSQGFYYPVVWCSFSINFGATNPSLLYLQFQIGAGSTVDFYEVDLLSMGANARINYFPTLVGTPSQTPWVSPGSVINITVNPTSQAVTSAGYASRYRIALLRAPDA